MASRKYRINKKETSFGEYDRDYEHLFKVVIVGDSGVGKSCLLVRFADDVWTPGSYIATVGVDFRFRTMRVDGKMVKFQIWDTAGHERFRSINASYFRGCDGAILCYDVSSRVTFSQIANHLAQVQEKGGDSASILVGNKADMKEERQVPFEHGLDLADQLRIPFFEVSAKHNQNVEVTFQELARMCILNKTEEDERQKEEQRELKRLSEQQVSPRVTFQDIRESIRESGGCC